MSQSQINKPQPFKREQFIAAILETEIAVMQTAAENMVTRLFAAAHGLPLTGTPEVKNDAEFTEKSLGAVILMAGFASDRAASESLSGRIWRNLNKIPEPVESKPVTAPSAPAKDAPARFTDIVPESERVLNQTVLQDTNTQFTRVGYMLQVMATQALKNISLNRAGKVARDFHCGNVRFTIRVGTSFTTATVNIYVPGKEPLMRDIGFNELWQFARARDSAALQKIGQSMIDNASMRRIGGGRAGTDEYAEGVQDTDDTNVPEDENGSRLSSDHDTGDDREPTMGELIARAAKRSGAQPRQRPR